MFINFEEIGAVMKRYRWRVAIIITASAVLSLGTIWFIFGLHASCIIGNDRALFLFLAVVVLLPIPFHYRAVKRRLLFTAAYWVLWATLVLVSFDTIAGLVFNIDNIWTERMTDLIQALFVLVAVMFIWRGIKASKETKRTNKT